MGFYQELSRYYDEVFPVNDNEMRFVSTLLKGRVGLLDVGCGTGNKTVRLVRPGRKIVAVDLDADMIATAATANRRPDIDYRVADMLKLGEEFPPASFDAAVCLGNTLVHLTEPGGVETFLRDMAALLSPGGLFIVQILNYDRIIDDNVGTLPRLEGEHAVFTRSYDWREGRLHFVTELEVRESGEKYDNDIILRPLRKHDLDEILKEAGFTTMEHYGGYAGTPYAKDSFHLIVAALRVVS